MKILVFLFSLMLSLSVFADSTVVNHDMGPVRLVRKVINFPVQDCLNHLTSHPGHSKYNWRCVVPLTDTVNAQRLNNYDTFWGVNSFGGKCTVRIFAQKSWLAMEINRPVSSPTVLPKSTAVECVNEAYNKFLTNGLQIFVLTTHSNIDPSPVVTAIEKPDSGDDSDPTPPIIVNPIPRPPLPRPVRPRPRIR